MSRLGLLIILLSWSFSVAAQEKKLVRRGNELYQHQRYGEAAAAYRQAVQQNPSFMPGSFNLGNAFIRQKQYDSARKVMAGAAKSTTDKTAQSGAHYNIGNTYMEQQQWQQAVDAYKQSLRANPQDADAKYNLSYALAKLKQQQQNGGGKDKNKDKDKKDDKNKDKKEGKDKKDQDKKDQGEKDKKEQDQKGDQDNKNESNNDQQGKEGQQRPQPQPSKLTQQQADNLLKALQQDERKLQDKMQQGKGVPVKTEKDW